MHTALSCQRIRKTIHSIFIVGFLLTWVWSTEISAEQSDKIISSVSRNQIMEIMKSEGYAVTINDAGNILWKIDGINAFMFVSNNEESLQFFSGIRDGNSTMEKVNDWNKTMRFSRSYLDDDRDPILELDLDLAGGVTKDRIVDFLKTCRSSFNAWISQVVR